MKYTSKDLNLAYDEAIRFAKQHYENFPVVTFLISPPLRKHVAIIYWFARTADDIADEGTLSVQKRLESLAHFEKRLQNLLNERFTDRFDFALFNTIKENNLTPNLFFKLLAAFRSDILFEEFNEFEDLLGYCSNSANPVGRLMLELHGIRDQNAFELSDKICTALQLTNFFQDIKVDIQRGRNYIPLNDLMKSDLNIKNYGDPKLRTKFCSVMKIQAERTLTLFTEGEELLRFLPKTLRIEIAWTIFGGRRMLEKIQQMKFNILRARPTLSKIEMIRLFFKAYQHAKRFS